jgi:hypothetical protein
MMRFLRRKWSTAAAADPNAAAAAFWMRWDVLLPEISAALGERQPHLVEHELCEAVAAMHPDLHFSIEQGERALYALVVTSQADPALRPLTDAWIAAAPPSGPLWEFHDAVPPVPDPTQVTVTVEARRLALADVRVAAQVDEQEGVVDVAVFHPGFAQLGEKGRAAMTFLPLDATLGERLAADRLRRVETAESEPADSMDLLALRTLIRGLPPRVGG